jgi:hypothetical protein
MKRGAFLLFGAVAGVSACTTIFGDVVFIAATGSGGGTTATGGGTATTSTVGTGGTTTTTGTGGDVVVCDAGTTVCGGLCVDMQTDGHNCGRCGHDCLYGACSSGMCQPWPIAKNADVSLAGGGKFADANQIDTDGKYLVWIDSVGNVNQVETPGGTIVPVSVKSATDGESGPALRSGTVAFLGASSTSVYTVAEGQVTAAVQATAPSGDMVGYLALDPSGTIAFLVGAGPVLRCPLTGDTCAPAFGQSAAGRVCVNSAHAFYWGDSPTSITSYNFVGGVTYSVATNAASNLAIDESAVYWIGGDTIYSLPQSFTNSAMSLTVASNPMGIMGLASDGTNVYFGEFNTSGNASLYYAPVGGGKATVLYTSSYDDFASGESYVVAAGGAVYWADVDFTGFPRKSHIMGIAAP